MHVKIAILILVAVSSNCYFLPYDINYRSEKGPFPPCTTFITCMCKVYFHQYQRLVQVHRNHVYDPITGSAKCGDLNYYPIYVCAMYGCVYSNENNPLSKKEMQSYSYPYVFTVPPRRDAMDRSKRQAEELESCYVPTLDNAIINCKKWADYIYCYIDCIYGHAHMNGEVTKNTGCRYNENVWKNKGFTDCRPYLNCEVQFNGGGKMNCTYPLDAPPICEIECWAYGEKKIITVPSKKYECIDETFGSSLPHCVALAKNVILAPKPF